MLQVSIRPRRAFQIAALLIAYVFCSGYVGQAYASDAWRPSRAQLRRLHNLEPYIRYFTSLTYGPRQAQVPAEYIRALILAESGANPVALSPMGARGVTQIIPETAQLVLAQLARTDKEFLYVDERIFDAFEADDLYNPAVNILIACYLSATYHDQYDGRTDLVVSAWNAGPGAVARYGNNPPPYPETRGLIRRLNFTMNALETLEIN